MSISTNETHQSKVHAILPHTHRLGVCLRRAMPQQVLLQGSFVTSRTFIGSSHHHHHSVTPLLVTLPLVPVLDSGSCNTSHVSAGECGTQCMWHHTSKTLHHLAPCDTQQLRRFARQRSMELALNVVKLLARCKFHARVVVTGWHMPMWRERVAAFIHRITM